MQRYQVDHIIQVGPAMRPWRAGAWQGGEDDRQEHVQRCLKEHDHVLVAVCLYVLNDRSGPLWSLWNWWRSAWNDPIRRTSESHNQESFNQLSTTVGRERAHQERTHQVGNQDKTRDTSGWSQFSLQGKWLMVNTLALILSYSLFFSLHDCSKCFFLQMKSLSAIHFHTLMEESSTQPGFSTICSLSKHQGSLWFHMLSKDLEHLVCSRLRSFTSLPVLGGQSASNHTGITQITKGWLGSVLVMEWGAWEELIWEGPAVLGIWPGSLPDARLMLRSVGGMHGNASGRAESGLPAWDW